MTDNDNTKSDIGSIMLASFSAGLVLGLVVMLITTNNFADVNKVGKYMCEQHHLQFVKAKMVKMVDVPFSFKVYCTNETAKLHMDDGYLVVD